MSDRMIDELKRQQSEDNFFRMAGQMISEEELAEFEKSQQEAPELPPELAVKFHKQNRELIERSFKKKKHRLIFRRLAQAAAALMICVGASGTALYVTVDAARDSINNFFLEQFEDHAVVKPDDGTDDLDENSGCAVPDDWDGPVTPRWVPKRYTDVEKIEAEGTYGLFYSSSQNGDYLIIYIVSGKYDLNIDTEDMVLFSETEIQNVPAKIYYKNDEKRLSLIFAKNDCTIRISGTVTVDEVEKVAENMNF